MTRTEYETVAGSVPERSALQRERKSALTCPRCHHTSSVDGDWELVIRPRATEVRCPDCYQLLTRRLRLADGEFELNEAPK